MTTFARRHNLLKNLLERLVWVILLSYVDYCMILANILMRFNVICTGHYPVSLLAVAKYHMHGKEHLPFFSNSARIGQLWG